MNITLENVLYIYHDEIIIFSRIFDGHILTLKKMFSTSSKNGLKLKAFKCEFFKQEVQYLGHIDEWHVPANVKKCSFVLFCGLFSLYFDYF